MSVVPNVTQAGTTTRGTLSDEIPITLANGWKFAMPMELYSDPTGNPLEGRGLQPREKIELYSLPTLDHGHAQAGVARILQDW